MGWCWIRLVSCGSACARRRRRRFVGRNEASVFFVPRTRTCFRWGWRCSFFFCSASSCSGSSRRSKEGKYRAVALYNNWFAFDTTNCFVRLFHMLRPHGHGLGRGAPWHLIKMANLPYHACVFWSRRYTTVCLCRTIHECWVSRFSHTHPPIAYTASHSLRHVRIAASPRGSCMCMRLHDEGWYRV